MVIDRGGLRYPIEVVDRFTANTQKFREEIRKSRQEFSRFAAQSKSLNASVAANQTAASKAAKETRAVEATASREKLRDLQAGIRRENEVRKLRAAANRDQRREAARVATAEKRSAAAQIRANREAARAAAGGIRGQRNLRGSIVQTESAASKLLFTFRRLVGVLALFTVARQAAQGFGALIRSGFQFNQTVEQSRLGIAGILTSVAAVTNEQGELVKGAEAYEIALGKAAEQQKKLQIDALRTTATFQELLNVFQIATGPGLAAGLQLDQIREVSVLVSQAASAIDLPQNQLSEEIRALLTGNIRQTTTRIAQVLNLKPEDIKNAKAQGQLYELLTRRLNGFSLAAEKTANTVGGLARRIVGAVEVIAGEAATGGFEELRTALSGIFDALLTVERGADGAIKSLSPSPEAVKVFQSIFSALEAIIIRAKAVGGALGLDGLADAAEGFAATLEFIGVTAVDVIAGIIRGFSSLKTVLSPVVAVFSAVADAFSAAFGDEATNSLVSRFSQLLTVGIGLQIAFGILNGSFLKIVAIVPGIANGILKAVSAMGLLNIQSATFVALSTKAAAVWASVVRVLGRMAVALGVVVLGFEQVFQAITGLDLTLKDTLKIIVLSFKTAWGTITRQAEIAWGTFANTLVGIFTNPIATIAGLINDGIIGPLLGVSAALASIGIITEKTRVDIEDAASGIERALASKASEQKDFFGISDQKVALQEFLDESLEKFTQLRADIAARGALGPGFIPGGPGTPAPTAPGGSLDPAPKEVTAEERRQADIALEKLELLRAELNLKQLSRDIGQSELTNNEKEVQLLEAQVNANEQKLALLKQQNQAALDFFESQNALQLGGDEGPAAQALAQKQLLALKGTQLEKEREIALQIESQIEAARRVNEIARGSLTDGLAGGLRDFAEQFSSQFQAGVNIMTGIMQRFTTFVSDSIVDAFDPTKDTSIRERFARLLQDIAKLIIQQLIQLAISSAIIKAGIGLPAGPPTGFGSFGGAEGGQVPRRARPGLAHYRGARGYAEGGGIGGRRATPPKGISPKDNVPIWAQKGEFMMRLSAVRKYGIGMMDALNRGMIDPSALPAMSGVRRSRTRRGAGFALGGEISNGVNNSSEAASLGGGGGGAAPTAAILVANDQAADRLLSGGKRAFLDMVEEFGGDIEGRLSQFRSQ